MAGARACSTSCAPAASARPPSTRWTSSRPATRKLGIATAALNTGFSWLEDGIDFVTETELFAAGPTTRRRKKQEQVSDVEALIKDLSELNVGDPVVHSAHGIGRYRGLINLDLGEKNADGTPALQEFLHLEYADKATLYVPVSQLQLISRYTGVSADEAPLHRWAAASGKRPSARPPSRCATRPPSCSTSTPAAPRAKATPSATRRSDYEIFANDFGFEETADQNAAIHAVIQDMISPRPMDRLVCGDVGFGKTEVALRAAFIAVTGGKQVALLAPTTLLAEQHYQTLVDRFAKWPVKVAEMSRFRSAKEITAAHQGPGRRQRRHRGRHAQAAERNDQVQEPGPAHHRRGTPLRRAPQGGR